MTDHPTTIANRVAMIGTHLLDETTGIAGRVTSVCFNENEGTQALLLRYGVDAHGVPFAQVWAYFAHCRSVSEQTARDA